MGTSLFEREPVAVLNAAIAIVETALVLAIAFGLELTSAQVGAIMGFVVAVTTLIRILLVRSQVTPVANPRDNAGNQLVPLPPQVPERSGMTPSPQSPA